MFLEKGPAGALAVEKIVLCYRNVASSLVRLVRSPACGRQVFLIACPEQRRRGEAFLFALMLKQWSKSFLNFKSGIESSYFRVERN